ncbi:MAG: TonB-dependent receptor, partial [Flavobacterium sp.]
SLCGNYYLNDLINSMHYFELVLQDTPIYNEALFAELRTVFPKSDVNGNRDLRNPSNGTVEPYAALAVLTTGKSVGFDANGNVISITTLANGGRMANSDLRWEETKAFNIGLDFSILKDRLSGTVEYYAKQTNNLLVEQKVPDITGYEFVYSNLAEIKNKGMDITLNSKNFSSANFKWNTNFNMSFSRNKIVKLALPADDLANGWFIGRDINTVWDYNVVGVWQENEVAEANKFNKAIRPGDFKLQDRDGNYIYGDTDKDFLGFTTPRFIFAMRNEFNIFKNFDVSFQLLSNWGQLKQFNTARNQPGSVGFARMNSYQVPYWTPSNPLNNYSRLNSGTSGTSFNVYRDNSFIRLNSVAVAYSLPQNLLSRVRVKNAKIYANVNNAYVWSRD